MGFTNIAFQKSSTLRTRPRTDFSLANFLGFMQEKGWYNVTATLAMQMYNRNSALGDAVDMIANAAKNIAPVVLRDDETFETEHEVLKLLKKPNPKESYKDFMDSLVHYFVLTGNNFITAIGNINRLPNQLYSTPTTGISAQGQGENYSVLVTAPNALKFLDGQYKYDSVTGRLIENDLTELVHLSRFINYTTTNGYVADSLLSSILYELEVLNHGNNHNLALLINGVSLSGVFNLDTQDSQAVAQFKQDVQNYFSGSGNAGKFLVSEGDTVTFTPTQMNNKDLQQDKNIERAAKVIYDRLQIPEPMRNNNAQTFANYEAAQYVFYDRAVFPVLDEVNQGLTSFFRNRKLLKDNEEITYDPTKIPALQVRFNEEIKLKKDTGVLTNNELRELQGYDNKGPENDILYQDGRLVPVGFMTSADDQAKAKFSSILRSRGYSEEEIKKKVDKHYGNSNK